MDALVEHAPATEEPVDPFGVAEAPRGFRWVAQVADALAVLGAPWLIALLCVPIALPFIELIPVAVVLLILSCAGALTTWLCSRLPNGERLSAGSMVAGLTVLRTDDAHRVVRWNDVEGPLRPKKGRVVGGRIGFALTTIVAATTIAASSWLLYQAAFQTQIAAASEAEWQAGEPEARRVCMAFMQEVLAGGPNAGDGYVVEAAADALPKYREHLADTGVMRFEENGYGQGSGDWEYMFVEIGKTPADAVDQAQVSVLVRKRGDRFVVTQLTWHTPSGSGEPE
jgi:hypothetical protein